jgi:hypothetical protein
LNYIDQGVVMNIISKEFENITRDSTKTDDNVGQAFGFLLFYHFAEYEDKGDQKAREILKQAILSVKKNRKTLFPQIWRRLNETHLDLIEDLFPDGIDEKKKATTPDKKIKLNKPKAVKKEKPRIKPDDRKTAKAILRISQEQVNFGKFNSGEQKQIVVKVENSGTLDLQWDIDKQPDWVIINKSQSELIISCNSNRSGQLSGEIQISSNGGTANISVSADIFNPEKAKKAKVQILRQN